MTAEQFNKRLDKAFQMGINIVNEIKKARS
jgi:hypothetical protein